MSDATAEAPKEPGLVGKILKLLVRLILAAVLVGAGFAGGWFYFANPMSPAQNALTLLGPDVPTDGAEDGDTAEGDGLPERIPRELPETALFETSYYQMEEPLTTNLKGSRSYLQIGVGMSTQYGAEVMTNVDTHKVALRSDILAAMGDFTEEDVAGANGRQALADAIKVIVNDRLEALEGFGGVEDVFFTSFVLQ